MISNEDFLFGTVVIWYCFAFLFGVLFFFKGPHKKQPAEQRRCAYEGQAYFTVSRRKFIALSVMTFNWYLLYWFYRNWWLVRIRENRSINPLIMSFFSFLFAYALFIRIEKLYHTRSFWAYFISVVLGLFFFIFSLIGLSNDPAVLVSIFSFVPVFFVNDHALKMEKINPHFILNDNFSPWDYGAISIGGGLLLIVVAAFLLL